LHHSNASMWALCEQMPEACQLVQMVDALFPVLVHGTYSASVNEMVTVGLFGQVTTDAGVFTVIMPYYIAPDSAVITGYQYAEFFLQFKDGLFPQDMGYLFGPETDLSLGPIVPDECVPQEVNDCITQILHTLRTDLNEREDKRNDDYNDLLEDAQTDARRCSPLHSLEGLWDFVTGAGVGAVFTACQIWEDFDKDVDRLDRDLHKDVCDMNKKAKDDIMDCLEECPQWMKDVFEARCDEAIFALGCA
jgi:hypothetical protein